LPAAIKNGESRKTDIGTTSKKPTKRTQRHDLFQVKPLFVARGGKRQRTVDIQGSQSSPSKKKKISAVKQKKTSIKEKKVNAIGPKVPVTFTKPRPNQLGIILRKRKGGGESSLHSGA